jgi:DNA-directed RNA polymerase specialized sigma24 family protein
VYLESADVLIGYFARRCRDPRTVAALTSETFVRAAERFAKSDPRRGSARAWLFGIATHVFARYCGSATFRLPAPTRDSWIGDLAVWMPNFGLLPLTGRGLEVGLCEAGTCTKTFAPGDVFVEPSPVEKEEEEIESTAAGSREAAAHGMTSRRRSSSKRSLNITSVSTKSWKPRRLAFEPSAIRS